MLLPEESRIGAALLLRPSPIAMVLLSINMDKMVLAL